MLDNKIARRYAKSLLLLTKEQGVLDEVYGDIERMRNITHGNRDLRRVFRSPVIQKDKKLKVFNAIFGDAIHPIWKGFVVILTKNNRESLLQEIANAFSDLYHEEKNIIEATVITASAMESNEIESIVNKMLTQANPEKVEITKEVDEDIIGGMIVRVGDNQIDASVSRFLRDIEKELVNEDYKVKL